MKRKPISQTGKVAVAILVLTVIFLAPVTVTTGEADTQKPDIQKPGTLKELIKKMEIAPNKPGAQLNYLFKLEIPVELKKVHPTVNKAAIFCLVSKSNPIGPDSWGQSIAEIPLQGGAYTGIINVYITELARSFYKPELIDKWECEMVFSIDGNNLPFMWLGNQSAQDPIGILHKPGTLFQVHIEGKF